MHFDKRIEPQFVLGKRGFRGFLMGEALMRAPGPEKALRDFVAAVEHRQPMRVSTGAGPL